MNRHFILFALAFAAALSGVAKTFDVDVSTGRPSAANVAYYHGETIEFRAVRGRSVVTNVEYSCIYYQTNGMGDVWWKTDGLTFHPTNDVGASSYRFFLEGRDDVGRDWHANGLLRLLDSPGFEPSAVRLPVQTIDFATVEVLNAPWAEIGERATGNRERIEALETNVYTKAETEAKIAELAPAPGNYAAVSNAAMNAVQPQSMTNYATRAQLDAGWWSEWEPGTYDDGTHPSYDFESAAWDQTLNCFVVRIVGGTLIEATSDGGQDDATVLTFTLHGIQEKIVRHRVAAPVPTKPSDIGAASVADATLTPVYSQTPTYVGGTVNPPTYDGATLVCARLEDSDSPYNGYWSVFRTADSRVINNALALPVPDSAIQDNTITWTGSDSFSGGVTATLVRTDIIGYTLGDQTTKPLQPQGEYATRVESATIATNAADYAVATADTSYRRYAFLTNVNQSIQFVTLPSSATELAIELPATGETKDFLVYVLAEAETPLTLPPATWWMADEAYTNAIPANQPTALYFSQVADGVFMLGRQELTTIQVTE